jgi:hypothetical protein
MAKHRRRLNDTAALAGSRKPRADDALYGSPRLAHSVEVRQVANGFIKRETHEDGNGYRVTESVHHANPGLTMSERPAAPSSDAMRRATGYMRAGRGL